MRLLVLLFLATFTLMGCDPSAGGGGNAASFDGEWRHSGEDDTATDEIYRPKDFNFPPVRARKNIVINADGTFVRNNIGPNDAFVSVTGKWTKDGSNLKVVLDDENSTTFTINTAGLSDGKLSVKK